MQEGRQEATAGSSSSMRSYRGVSGRPFDLVLAFDIHLLQVETEIWRLIEVPATYTMWDLHVAIQDAMGWQDRHLHQFRLGGDGDSGESLIGIPVEGFEGGQAVVPGWEVAVKNCFTPERPTASYEYDFGDGWLHTVTFIGNHMRDQEVVYPRCTAGERACPPEDCGGAPGYADLLRSLSDPERGEHDRLEWIGHDFEPETFELKEVRFRNPITAWRRVFEGRYEG